MNRGRLLSAILAGCSAAAIMIVTHEGWVDRGYRDPVGKPTACAGVTDGVEVGRDYGADCVAMTAAVMATHGAQIAGCLPEALPNEVRGAFTSFAYNVGSSAFCGSTMARKARGGDLRGACAEFSRWVYVGGKDCRIRANNCHGIVDRRADERALCERGLS